MQHCAHALVELFAGGCAVTHASAPTGKRERVIACDITESPAVFVAACYADPPYRNTPNGKRYGDFDFCAFDMWPGGVDFPVYVGEYDAPRGCVEVTSKERSSKRSGMNAKGNVKRAERIFVQERFAGAYEPEQGRLL